MRERGSAMLTAIVSVMVLLLVSGVFFSLVTDQMKSNAFEERAIKAYYLAQAGVFYGIAYLKAGGVPTLIVDSDGIKRSEEDIHTNPFQYDGQFTVQWEEYLSGYKITSIGAYGKDTGLVERTLQAYYKTSSSGGTPGEVPTEIITQALLYEGVVGDSNTSFVFSNTATYIIGSAVNLNLPLYIFTTNHGGNAVYNRYAKNVRISLENEDGDTIPLTTVVLDVDSDREPEYYYIVNDFKGVTGVNLSGTGAATSFEIKYNGSETVRLVVEGNISNQAHKLGSMTWTTTNYFRFTTDDGLIWQVEE